MAKADD